MGNSAGRPYYFAVLPEEKPRIDIIERFFGIIETLTTRESRGLARALYRSHSTILTDWKTRRHIPSHDVILRVIEWDERGRKVMTRKVTQSYVDLF